MTIQRCALFLDRDGVINIDNGYVCDPERFEFVDGIFELCHIALKRHYAIFVVTNQAGIGRGYYTERQFHDFSSWMCRQFLLREIKIEHVYYCPFHPEHGLGDYRRESDLRKPGPGMILQAAREYGVDLAASCLVGDKETDILAGLAAGVGINLLYCPGARSQAVKSAGTSVIEKLLEAEKYLTPMAEL